MLSVRSVLIIFVVVSRVHSFTQLDAVSVADYLNFQFNAAASSVPSCSLP